MGRATSKEERLELERWEDQTVIVTRGKLYQFPGSAKPVSSPLGVSQREFAFIQQKEADITYNAHRLEGEKERVIALLKMGGLPEEGPLHAWLETRFENGKLVEKLHIL